MAKLDPPQLRSGPLSGRVLVITHGKFEGDYLEASRKYDVTDQFDALARERGWTPPAASTQPPSPQDANDSSKEGDDA